MDFSRAGKLLRDVRAKTCVFRLIPLGRGNVGAWSACFAWKALGRRKFLRRLGVSRQRANTRGGAQRPAHGACRLDKRQGAATGKWLALPVRRLSQQCVEAI